MHRAKAVQSNMLMNGLKPGLIGMVVFCLCISNGECKNTTWVYHIYVLKDSAINCWLIAVSPIDYEMAANFRWVPGTNMDLLTDRTRQIIEVLADSRIDVACNVCSVHKVYVSCMQSSLYEGHPLNKLLNGIILLIFKIWKIQDICFIQNLVYCRVK